jgi:hypothetical protein
MDLGVTGCRERSGTRWLSRSSPTATIRPTSTPTRPNSLIEAPQWQDVLTGAGSRFHGELSYADNWDA